MDAKDYKVIIISPEDKDNNLNGGQTVFLGKIEENISHSEIMINYDLKTYGDNSIFGILNQGYYLPIYPAFFLTEYQGNIVFLNISSRKSSKQGLLYLPNDLSDIQINVLNNLAKELKGFNIEINKNLFLDDGLVDGTQSYIVCDGADIISKKNSKKRL